MDLGATLCTRSSPACERCPLAARCVALATGRTAELPIKKPKKAKPEKHATLLAVVDRQQVLLEQRPDSGIWGGLLSLPELNGHALEAAIASSAGTGSSETIGIALPRTFGDIEGFETLLPLVHVFTHYKLHITPVRIALTQRVPLAAPYVWWDLSNIEAAPLPAPVKKLLAQPDLFA